MSIIQPKNPRSHVKRYRDRKGEKVGMLTFVSYSGTIVLESTSKDGTPKQNSYAKWKVRCECGATKEINSHYISKFGQHCGEKECKMVLINRNRKEKLVNEREIARQKSERARLRSSKTLQLH